jgi:hypothetical protein
VGDCYDDSVYKIVTLGLGSVYFIPVRFGDLFFLCWRDAVSCVLWTLFEHDQVSRRLENSRLISYIRRPSC